MAKKPSDPAALNEFGAVHHSMARDRFSGIEPGISVREGMDQWNREFFRPGEATPKRKNQMIELADDVYRYNGIIKFVIDMMTDFVCQGMQIYHPSPAKERRYRHWWRKVNGNSVSERLVNHLYRHGTAIPKRNFAQLSLGDVKDLQQGTAANVPYDPTADVPYNRSPLVRPNRIPLQYTFLNPMMVDVIGGYLALFAATPDKPVRYALRVPDSIAEAIRNPPTVEMGAVIANLPNYLLSGSRYVELDHDKVSVLSYKKDDWQLWADPLVLCILDDILLLKKMKEADKAALEGSLSRIRLWTLGLPEHKIQPGPGAFKRLKNQLLAAVGGGSMDLVWDASLKLQESSTDVYKFLGQEKYEPVLRAIYAGLGIPQSLVGGKSDGMTQGALSLKTLIERLQYARNILIDFWEGEFAHLQRAFGDRRPARLRFELMSLSDEASEKMIWVQLYDRNLVTIETMREKFGLLHDVESARLRREYKQADAGNAPAKLGPFAENQPNPDQLLKTAMQAGAYTPSEAGAKPKPKRKGEKSVLDRQDERKIARRDAKRKGQSGQGRPRNSKDTKPRKKRTPKASVARQLEGRSRLREITAAYTPVYLAEVGKSNLRQLSTIQAAELEGRKFALLCGDPPTNDGEPPAPHASACLILDELISEHYPKTTPPVDQLRELQLIAYSLLGDDDGPLDD